jgi:outer membrane autotransporter protein
MTYFPRKKSSRNARAVHGLKLQPSVLALALAGVLALPGAAMAADWVGTTSDWFDPNNWNPAAVPTAADNVFLDTPNPSVIDASGGNAANVQNATIGNNAGGKGVLTIQNGGVLSGTNGVVGSNAGSIGEVTVVNQDSVWFNTNALLVGASGTGTLTILDGASVSNGTGIVGLDAGSSGLVTVNGKSGNVNSKWTNNGDLIIGGDGAGTLVITNAGNVFNNIGTLGASAGSTGAATVDGAGSTWANAQELVVGSGGAGTLVISNGGTVTNTDAAIGVSAGSVGKVTVTGAGSAWTSTGNLFVGLQGSGALAITAGGQVTHNGAGVGVAAGSSGVVTVDGAGSALTSSFDSFIGDAGTGSLAITNGGTVSNATGFIGFDTTGNGKVTVDGAGSTWTSAGGVAVGFDGTGTLAITHGGVVNSSASILGFDGTGTGTATVDGKDSVWANTGTLVIGQDGKGTVTVSNGGSIVSAVGIVLGVSAGSTGELNIGAAPGSAPAAPGTLTTPLVLLAAGDGTLNFNHTSANYVFDTPINGGPTGKITNLAGNTNLTGDSTNFSGQTFVNGGRLSVNGSLAQSAVTVNNKGTLGGGGTVGNLLANAGGTVAPGNSIGTLSVNGNVTQQAGSIYAVEVSAANADLIDATGTATIQSGAILKAIKFGAAPLLLGKKYMVLQANGGVAGKYSLIGNSAFLAFADTYDANHAYLTVTKSKTFVDVAMTPNQKAAASGVEGLGAGNVIYDAISVLQTDGEAQAAFDQVSGEIHPTVRAVQIEDSRFVRDAALDRLRSFDGQAASLTVMPKAEDGKAADLPSTRDLAYWGRAMGGWGRINGDGNAATVKRDTAGFLLGVDRMVNDDWRLGILSGYSRSSMDVNERNSSATSDNYHLGLYGGRRWGDLVLRSGAAYTAHSISTSRTPVFAGFSDNLKADYTAETMQAFGELGWRIKSGNTEFEPFAGLAHVNVSSDGFIERGGPAALTGRVAHSGVTFSTLGLRATSDFELGSGTSVTARGSLGWRHAFGDTLADTGLSFGNGAPFVVYGVPIAKSAAVVEAGLDFKLSPLTTLGVSYGGQFGSGLRDQSARVNFKVAF